MAMKIMSARDAKNHFGEFLDAVRREPVVVTNNDGAYGCAFLEGGSLRCWGRSLYGVLGYPGSSDVGDDEVPGAVGPVQYE